MFKTILLPVDLSEESSWSKALPAAVLHARSDGGSLSVVTVVPDFGESIVGTYFPPDFIEQSLAATKTELEAQCAARVPADISLTPLVRRGAIYHEIIGTAEEIGADLIVMASHRPALRDYLIGPNAARVVRHAKCSVLVVRA